MTTTLSVGWMAFWLLLAVYVWCEHTQYMAGNDTILWSYKTPQEKRIQDAIVGRLEAQTKKANP